MKGSMYAMKHVPAKAGISGWWVIEGKTMTLISGPYDDEFDAYAWIMRGHAYES
ncbi:MAG: hypothetical protein MN733_28550 [Nitrososphaera sp.]|nr:hypothetical protein [Nitrososphaera sp.]